MIVRTVIQVKANQVKANQVKKTKRPKRTFPSTSRSTGTPPRALVLAKLVERYRFEVGQEQVFFAVSVTCRSRIICKHPSTNYSRWDGRLVEGKVRLARLVFFT